MVFLCGGREVSEVGKGGGRGNHYKLCNILPDGFPVLGKVLPIPKYVNTMYCCACCSWLLCVHRLGSYLVLHIAVQFGKLGSFF